MADNGNKKKLLPPYLPYRTFQNFIDGLRVTMPTRIDKSVMRSMSGAMQSWMLSTLRYLNLTNDYGVPTERLKKLASAQGTERQKILREVLKSSYSKIFSDSLNLEAATPHQLEEQFSDSGATGETLRKCISFFLAAAKDADLQLSPYLQRQARSKRGTGRRVIRFGGRGRNQVDDSSEDSKNNMAELLMAKFPNFDPSWPDDVKAKWFEGFERLMQMMENNKD